MAVRTFEIYLNMLTKTAQKEYLNFQGVKSPSDLNADIMPIATVDLDDEAIEDDEEIDPDEFPTEDEFYDEEDYDEYD
jgi:hypothetical protein